MKILWRGKAKANQETPGVIKPESVGRCNLNRVGTGGHMAKGRSGKRLKGGEKVSLADIWRKSAPGRGKRQCKGLEAGKYWLISKD